MTDYIRNKINLKKIVDAPDPNSSKLGPAAARFQVAGTRSIGYMNSDGVSAGSVQGQPGSTLLGNKAPPSGQIKAPGTTQGNKTKNKEAANNKIDPKNPQNGGGGHAPGNGKLDLNGQPAEKTLAEILDEQIKKADQEATKEGTGEVISPDNGGNTVNLLDGAKDCGGSGIDLDLRMDGALIPPTDWIDENTPPDTDVGASHIKVIGTHWMVAGTPSGQLFSESEAGIVSATFAAFGYNEADFLLDHRNVVDDGFSDYHVGYLFHRVTPAAVLGFTAFRQSCSPGVDDACPIEFPPTIWPEDNKMQVQRVNGQFVINPHEPDADKFTLLATSINGYIDFCWGDCPGEACKSGVIMPTHDMGWMIGQTDYPGGPLSNFTKTIANPAGGPPITIVVPGQIKTFDTHNQMNGALDTSNYQSMLPGNPPPPSEPPEGNF